MKALKDTIEKLDPLFRRLASDNREEVANTAAAIVRVLAVRGYDLNDLVDDMRAVVEPAPASKRSKRANASRGATHAETPRPAPANDHLSAAVWGEQIATLWARGQRHLKERDLQFLATVWGRAQAGKVPSQAQRKWIGDIESKLCRQEARAG